MILTDIAYDLTDAADKLADALLPAHRSADVPEPCEVYDLLGEIRATVDSLSNVLRELADHSRMLAAESRLRSCAPGTAAVTLARQGTSDLQHARRSLETVRSALDAAQGAYDALYLTEVGEVAG